MSVDVSRQRRWQIKQRQEGKCEICGKYGFRAGYCRFCYVERALGQWLDTSRAKEAARKIVRRWADIETGHLPTMPGWAVATLPREAIHWIEKWDRRIGGWKNV